MKDMLDEMNELVEHITLTTREFQTLLFSQAAHSESLTAYREQTAERLGISENTVDRHISNSLDALRETDLTHLCSNVDSNRFAIPIRILRYPADPQRRLQDKYALLRAPTPQELGLIDHSPSSMSPKYYFWVESETHSTDGRTREIDITEANTVTDLIDRTWDEDIDHTCALLRLLPTIPEKQLEILRAELTSKDESEQANRIASGLLPPQLLQDTVHTPAESEFHPAQKQTGTVGITSNGTQSQFLPQLADEGSLVTISGKIGSGKSVTVTLLAHRWLNLADSDVTTVCIDPLDSYHDQLSSMYSMVRPPAEEVSEALLETDAHIIAPKIPHNNAAETMKESLHGVAEKTSAPSESALICIEQPHYRQQESLDELTDYFEQISTTYDNALILLVSQNEQEFHSIDADGRIIHHPTCNPDLFETETSPQELAVGTKDDASEAIFTTGQKEERVEIQPTPTEQALFEMREFGLKQFDIYTEDSLQP